jgi:hypothetical protein
MRHDTARYQTYFPQAEFDRPRTRLRINPSGMCGRSEKAEGGQTVRRPTESTLRHRLRNAPQPRAAVIGCGHNVAQPRRGSRAALAAEHATSASVRAGLPRPAARGQRHRRGRGDRRNTAEPDRRRRMGGPYSRSATRRGQGSVRRCLRRRAWPRPRNSLRRHSASCRSPFFLQQ